MYLKYVSNYRMKWYIWRRQHVQIGLCSIWNHSNRFLFFLGHLIGPTCRKFVYKKERKATGILLNIWNENTQYVSESSILFNISSIIRIPWAGELTSQTKGKRLSDLKYLQTLDRENYKNTKFLRQLSIWAINLQI